MRPSGYTRLDLVIAAALLAAVVGLGLAVGGACCARARMSEARRDVAEMKVVLGATPAVAAQAASTALDSAPPKTAKRRAKKRPATAVAGAPSAAPRTATLSSEGTEGDLPTLSLAGDSSSEPDENAPSIFMLAPLDGLADLDDDDPPAEEQPEPAPAPQADSP